MSSHSVAARPSATALSPLIPLAKAEFRIGLRSMAFRTLALLSLLAGLSVGAAPGRGASLSAFGAAEVAWTYLGLLSVAWMSLAAVRVSALRTGALLYSKPQPTERIVFLRFCGAAVGVVGMFLALFAGAAIARLFIGNGITGF